MGKKETGALIFCFFLAVPSAAQDTFTRDQVLELRDNYREMIGLLQEEAVHLRASIESYERETAALKEHIEAQRKYNEDLLSRLGTKKRGFLGNAWWGLQNVAQPLFSACVAIGPC